MTIRARLRILSSALAIAWNASPIAAQSESASDAVPDRVAATFAQRHIGVPGDVQLDIETAMPRPDALFPELTPRRWTALKESIADRYGLKLALSYQQLFQHASETTTGRDQAWGQWLQVDAEWDAIDPDGDYHGSLVTSVDWRDSIGGNTAPAFFRFDTGSLWQTDPAYLEWRVFVTEFFWQQWLGKDRFVFRVGQHSSGTVLDFFRFGDLRSSFSNSQSVFPTAIDPVGPAAFGASFKWWPIDGAELYVIGTVTDINGPQPSETNWDWGGLFREGEAYAGVEFGHNWRRSDRDFDHAHITAWYADEVSGVTHPTDDGWGVKVHGEKQLDRTVVFANYGYNTSRGGGFGMTNSRQAVNVGLGFLRPCGVSGEMAAAVSWGQTLEESDPLLGIQSGREQYGAEMYWKILLTPNMWVTPGVQLIGNPTFNLPREFIAIPQLKFRTLF